MLGTFMAELLEARPEDVHGFAAQFFADRGLAVRLGFEGWERPETEAPPEEEEEEGPLAAVSGDSVEDLEALLVNLFKEADVDGSGALDYKEFRAVMKTAQLGLSSDDVKHLLAEADEDGNGLIEYAEFVPLAVDVVQTLRLKAKVREQEAVLGDDARMLAMEMLNGLSKDELLELLKACFNEADKDASGALSRAELKRVLRSARLGLTEHQINLVMVNVDADHDGALTFEEVGPLIYEIMLESTAEMLRAQSLDETGVEISRAFERADKGGDGVLEVKAAKKVLEETLPRPLEAAAQRDRVGGARQRRPPRDVGEVRADRRDDGGGDDGPAVDPGAGRARRALELRAGRADGRQGRRGPPADATRAVPEVRHRGEGPPLARPVHRVPREHVARPLGGRRRRPPRHG